MKSKISQFLKSSLFNYVQRFVIVCVFLFDAAAAAGYHRVKATISVDDGNTGSGKVYVKGWGNDVSDTLGCKSTVKVMTTSGDLKGGSPETITPKIKLEANAGTKSVVAKCGSVTITTLGSFCNLPKIKSAATGVSIEDYGVYEATTAISVKFIARKYVLKSPTVGMLFKDTNGDLISDANSGCKIGWAFNDSESSADKEQKIKGGVEYSQDADNCGLYAKASMVHYYYAEASEQYEFVGWATGEDGDVAEDKTSSKLELTTTSTYEKRDDGTYVGEQASSQAPTYYAVFRRKFIGYNQPCQINISGEGQISVDGSNWEEADIKHTPTIQYVSSVTTPTEQISVKYYAQNKVGSTFSFEGWYDDKGIRISADKTYTCTYTYTPTVEVAEDLKCPPTLTAKFVPNNYYYKDFAQAIALPEEDGETYLGKVYVDKGEYATNLGGITEWNTIVAIGDENASAENGYQFSYTYYAKPNEGGEYAFKEWVTIKVLTDSEGNPIGAEETVVSDKPVFVYTVDYINKDWEAGEGNAFIPPVLYARFQTSRYYYHGRARVGVATNSELGAVFVGATETDAPEYYTPTEEQPFYTSQEAVEDKDGDGKTDTDIIETELNQNKYKYYYYAQPSENAVFKGWTVIPTGDNIVSNANPYVSENIASETPTAEGPMPLYAVFHSYYHTLPRVVSVGSGKVKINDKTDFLVEIDDATAIPTRPDKDDEGNDKNYYTYTYTLTAQADEGATFLGWSTSDSEEDIKSRETTYTVKEMTSSISSETPHRITMYAIFESDIKIKHADRMIYYEEDGAAYINDVNIILEVANAATVNAKLTGNTTDFELVNSTLTVQGDKITFDATTSIVPLRLMYVGDDSPLSGAVGKQVNITFTSYDSEGNQLAANGKVVTVEQKPVVTFLPADGKGSYTVSQTDGSGIVYTLGEETDQSVKIDVTHENKSYLQINLTDKADDGMEFFAWQVIENYGTAEEKISYLSYEKIYTHHFTKSVVVRPEFIPEGWARYIIKSNPEVQYFDFNKAIAQARVGVNGDEKMIVVYRNGLLPKGDYTLPKGVTLLVPGEGPEDGFGSADYLCQTNGALGVNDYLIEKFSAAKYKCYRKLMIEDGTRLTVAKGANVCVSARMIIDGQSLLAFPYHYGHIELGNDAVIDVAEGATLYAWGYITNPNDQQVTMHNYHDVGRVVAESGASVWEPLSFTDFRGGSATISFVKLSGFAGLAGGIVGDTDGYRHEVFPINQYYVQAIEAPLILHSGATENLSTAIHANEATSTTPAVLIGTDNGLFRWGTSTAKMIKYYDAEADRTKYIVEDEQNSATSVKLGNIGLKLSVLNETVDVNSSDYIMPVTNGMDIYIRNAKIEFPSGIDIALMAGSSMHVDKNSNIVNNAQIYVYDKDQNVIKEGLTTGYFGSTDAQILPIKSRPYTGLKVTRTVNSITDASLIVDGEVDCTNGYLITTLSGANITSNGGGKIKVAKFGAPSGSSLGKVVRNQSAFQYNQKADGDLAVGYVAMSLAINNNTYYPRLHNSGDSYTEATTAGTYYYCNGTWSTTACSGDGGYQEPFVDYTPRFTLTAPELDGYVGEGDIKQTVDFELSKDKLLDSDWATVVWDATFTGRDANLFEFNKEKNLAVTFRPASEGTKTAVMIITATYTRDDVDYLYSQAVDLVATAKLQTANTLAFADFATLYVGQIGVDLWSGKNNAGAVTINVVGNEDGIISQPDANGKFSALKEGTVTVTISQEANDHIAATSITTTITVKPRVVWNWSELYYPSVNTNPITMMDGSTDWTLEEVIIAESGDIVKFEGNSPETYTAEIFDLINGEYEVNFKFKQGDYEETFHSMIYRDLRYVRVDVSDTRVFDMLTVGKHEGVVYDDNEKSVTITSPELATNNWTIHFLGVPDKLYFIPTGDKPWQIEESTNGKTWTTTFTWAYIPESKIFEYSLMPSTQYVRISYAANGEATLQDVYITKLEGVKFYPEKLYMPAAEGATRNVAITYVSDKDVTVAPSVAGEFNANPASLSKTTAEPFYKVENVVITNEACVEQKLTGVNVVSSIGTEILPIQAYTYPQALPIVLASDMPAERFYYVAEHTYNTTWNETTRTMTMHNAVAKAQPFVTFHYTGAPTYISFNHTADANGEWIIEESVDGVNWTTCIGAETSAGYIKQTVLAVSKYIRITYNSLHTCKVDITNLMIIGEEGASVDQTEIKVEYVNENTNSKEFTVTAINLANGMKISTDNSAFTLTHGTNGVATAAQSFTLTSAEYSTIFAKGAMENLGFKVYFDGSKAVDYATITIENRLESGEIGKVLATVKVTGVRKSLTDGTINISTGVPSGYTLNGTFEGKEYSPLDINDAFAGGTALFDYLFIFGETTTMDGTKTITTPTSIAGSNAKTPCYIYKKNGSGGYDSHAIIENANVSTKVTQDFLKLTGEGAETLKVYITGFCPYASTGYTKQDEGVFFFQGGAGDSVHVYLEDCYLYSRSKTENGRFFENRSDGQSFTESYVRGSGGVLVFECSNSSNQGNPFNVTIHTRGTNMFKSHYGCFLESVAGRAFQVSSPVQVHMQTDGFIEGSYTTLSFDDIWPKIDGSGDERTNGFLSLQKQVNNAPSIDLGNAKTVVNFNGGQIELQNAQNVSDNYKSTLAISHRDGTFAGFLLAYGLGSDGVGGTVNFTDGTTTVLRMKVDERYRQYYLMDEDGVHTSCLRCPQNTYVTGGSHCMMRACSEPTSKGGAPKSAADGVALGLYRYPFAAWTDDENVTHKGGWTSSGEKGLVSVSEDNLPNPNYGVESVTPNTNGTQDIEDDFLNFWVSAGYDDSATPEVDQKISFWKACMTEIAASYASYGGAIGGDLTIEMEEENQKEIVTNLLYCVIDQNIHDVIRDNYYAPVKSPLPSGDPYLSVKPTTVGEEPQHYITNAKSYKVENKVYYITTALADTWMNFTAPFNVAKVYVVETSDESYFYENDGKINIYREDLLKKQARHNADFAAFFGVSLALKSEKTFNDIFKDYLGWAGQQEGCTSADKYELVHYYRIENEQKEVTFTNWDKASYFLYKNGGPWVWSEEKNQFVADWQFVVPEEGQPLMKQGETYSMMFPYCTGCDVEEDNEGNITINSRDYWDYWTGKFLIFESTDGATEGHVIKGADFVAADGDLLSPYKDYGEGTSAILLGNSTFAEMKTKNENVWTYSTILNEEGFSSIVEEESEIFEVPIKPTESFLFADVQIPETKMIKRIARDGRIIYRSDDNSDDGGIITDNHVPTINGGSDLFVTSVAEGINIAVGEPQYVGVFSATGQLIYNGWVETSVDVDLVVDGVYVVVGENESVKILY